MAGEDQDSTSGARKNIEKAAEKGKKKPEKGAEAGASPAMDERQMSHADDLFHPGISDRHPESRPGVPEEYRSDRGSRIGESVDKGKFRYKNESLGYSELLDHIKHDLAKPRWDPGAYGRYYPGGRELDIPPELKLSREDQLLDISKKLRRDNGGLLDSDEGLKIRTFLYEKLVEASSSGERFAEEAMTILREVAQMTDVQDSTNQFYDHERMIPHFPLSFTMFGSANIEARITDDGNINVKLPQLSEAEYKGYPMPVDAFREGGRTFKPTDWVIVERKDRGDKPFKVPALYLLNASKESSETINRRITTISALILGSMLPGVVASYQAATNPLLAAEAQALTKAGTAIETGVKVADGIAMGAMIGNLVTSEIRGFLKRTLKETGEKFADAMETLDQLAFWYGIGRIATSPAYAWVMKRWGYCKASPEFRNLSPKDRGLVDQIDTDLARFGEQVGRADTVPDIVDIPADRVRIGMPKEQPGPAAAAPDGAPPALERPAVQEGAGAGDGRVALRNLEGKTGKGPVLRRETQLGIAPSTTELGMGPRKEGPAIAGPEPTPEASHPAGPEPPLGEKGSAPAHAQRPLQPAARPYYQWEIELPLDQFLGPKLMKRFDGMGISRDLLRQLQNYGVRRQWLGGVLEDGLAKGMSPLEIQRYLEVNKRLIDHLHQMYLKSPRESHKGLPGTTLDHVRGSVRSCDDEIRTALIDFYVEKSLEHYKRTHDLPPDELMGQWARLARAEVRRLEANIRKQVNREMKVLARDLPKGRESEPPATSGERPDKGKLEDKQAVKVLEGKNKERGAPAGAASGPQVRESPDLRSVPQEKVRVGPLEKQADVNSSAAHPEGYSSLTKRTLGEDVTKKAKELGMSEADVNAHAATYEMESQYFGGHIDGRPMYEFVRNDITKVYDICGVPIGKRLIKQGYTPRDIAEFIDVQVKGGASVEQIRKELLVNSGLVDYYAETFHAGKDLPTVVKGLGTEKDVRGVLHGEHFLRLSNEWASANPGKFMSSADKRVILQKCDAYLSDLEQRISKHVDSQYGRFIDESQQAEKRFARIPDTPPETEIPKPKEGDETRSGKRGVRWE